MAKAFSRKITVLIAAAFAIASLGVGYFLFARLGLTLSSEGVFHANLPIRTHLLVSVKNAREKQDLEKLIGRTLPEIDFSENYYYYSTARIRSIEYRRYDKFRLSKPWYPAEVEFSEPPMQDSIVIYKSNPIYVAMPVMFQ